MIVRERVLIGNQKDLLDSTSQARSFFEYFVKRLQSGEISLGGKRVILCPSYPHLAYFASYLRDHRWLSIQLGAQDVSEFASRQHTGEIPATQIKEFADYVIIGHSERRDMGETDEQRRNKSQRARDVGLQVIYCVRNEEQDVIGRAKYIAYEPPSAIGGQDTDPPENIERVLGVLAKKYPGSELLYGGAVNPDTIERLLIIPNLSGFLVGRASVDPQAFIALLSKC